MVLREGATWSAALEETSLLSLDSGFNANDSIIVVVVG